MAQTGNDLALTSHHVPDAAAAPSIQTNEVQPRQTARIALQLGDRYMLLESRNDATHDGDQVMRQVRHEYDLAVAEAKRRRCLPRSPFWKPALSIGTMSTVWPYHDVESGEALREVAFSQMEYSTALTAAFFRPDILRGTGPFAEQYPDTVVGIASAKAVVIGSKVNKQAVVCLAGLALAVAIGVGLGIGIGTSNVQTGFACFAGVCTVLTLLIGILQWATK